MTAVQEATSTTSEHDPIDDLIPRPRPWWVRLLVALIAVVVVGTGSFLWGRGYIYPQPDCCGSFSGGAIIALSPDQEAVTVTAYFFNSGGHTLRIESATAGLPGATVREVRLIRDGALHPPANTTALPAEVDAGSHVVLAITFTPDTCDDTIDAAGVGNSSDSWGTLTLHLEVVDNGWLPSIGRDFTLPEPVFGPQNGNLSVYTPDENFPYDLYRTPLAAACALLGRTD